MTWLELHSQPGDKHSISQCQFTSAGTQWYNGVFFAGWSCIAPDSFWKIPPVSDETRNIWRQCPAHPSFLPCIFLCLCVYADRDNVQTCLSNNLSLPFTFFPTSLDSWFRVSTSHHNWMKTFLHQLPYLSLLPCCKVLPITFTWKVFLSVSALMLLLLPSALFWVLFLLIVA